MDYQPHLTSRSPTATHESSPFMPEVEYPSLLPDLISELVSRAKPTNISRRR
jgi:hypothetical protein